MITNTISQKKHLNRVKINLSAFLIESRTTAPELAKLANMPYSTIHSYIQSGFISVKSLRSLELSVIGLSKYLNK